MACKSSLSAGLLVAVCMIVGGCQNTAPRSSTQPAFTQRPGAASPPLVSNNPQFAQPGAVNPAFNSAPAGMGGVPTATSTTVAGQVRSTQPFPLNNTGSTTGPDMRSGLTTVGGNPPPTAAPGNSSFGSPALEPPIQPPVNPALGGPAIR
jgi:hypothetical protein